MRPTFIPDSSLHEMTVAERLEAEGAFCFTPGMAQRNQGAEDRLVRDVYGVSRIAITEAAIRAY